MWRVVEKPHMGEIMVFDKFRLELRKVASQMSYGSTWGVDWLGPELDPASLYRPALALLSSDPKNDEWVRCQNLPVENPLHFLTWCSRGTKTKPRRRHGAYKSLFKIWILLWAFIQSFEKLLNLNFSFLHISHQHCLRKLTKISALSNCYVKNCHLYFIFWNKNHLEVWFYMNVPSKVDA